MSAKTYLCIHRSGSAAAHTRCAVSVAYVDSAQASPSQYAMALTGGTWLCTRSESLVPFITRAAAYLATLLADDMSEQVGAMQMEDMGVEARLSLQPIAGRDQLAVILECVEPVAYSYKNSAAGTGSLVRLYIARHRGEMLHFLRALARLDMDPEQAERHRLDSSIDGHEIIPFALWHAGDHWRDLGTIDLNAACRQIQDLIGSWADHLNEPLLDGLEDWVAHQGLMLAVHVNQPSANTTLFAHHLDQSVTLGRYTVEQLAQTYQLAPSAVRDCIQMTAGE